MIHAPSSQRSQFQRRLGTAAVEFAVLLPLLATMMVGIWEVGRMIEVQQVLYNAAREGARQASTSSVDLPTITANVKTYIQNAEPGITNLSGYNLTYTNITNSGVTDPTNAAQLDRFRITITVPYSNVAWTTVPQITNVTTLTAMVDWYSMKDIPVKVTTTLPVD